VIAAEACVHPSSKINKVRLIALALVLQIALGNLGARQVTEALTIGTRAAAEATESGKLEADRTPKAWLLLSLDPILGKQPQVGG
jgi:hypothetical protein